MRIGFVSPELHRSRGTERGNYEVMARLAREHRVCLFAYRWEPDGEADICFHSVPVMPWPGLLRYLSFFTMASWQVHRAGERHGGFDAIYSPGANCRQVQVSSAWFCQRRQLELFRSGKHRPAPASLMDWLKLGHRWSYAAVVSCMERMFYASPRLRRVVTQSHLLARDLQNFYGLPPERVRVAHGGVNAAHFLPEQRAALRERARHELALPDDRFVFFFIGNNWLIKGLYHVIRALALVPEAQLLVVGAGVERTESWRRMAEECGVAERIRFVGRRPDIIYYYAAADALLAPSVYDTFPLMPLEAMACGVPVIISRNTGVAEIVGSEDAIVVENIENTAELAGAMERMRADAALRERLVANGFRLAAARPWDGIFHAIEEELLATAVAQAAKEGRVVAPRGAHAS